jgi:hypothetical protein
MGVYLHGARGALFLFHVLISDSRLQIPNPGNFKLPLV